jgi:hypothetical protein
MSMRLHAPRLRTVLAFTVAAAVGVFLSVASHELAWPESTTLVVAVAMVTTLALFGTPLILLPLRVPTRAIGKSKPSLLPAPFVLNRRAAQTGLAFDLPEFERIYAPDRDSPLREVYEGLVPVLNPDQPADIAQAARGVFVVDIESNNRRVVSLEPIPEARNLDALAHNHRFAFGEINSTTDPVNGNRKAPASVVGAFATAE